MTDELRLEIFEPDVDRVGMDEAARSLRSDLLQLDVPDVRSVSAGEAPPGAKGVELAAVGALVVVLQGSVGLVDQVVSTVRAWLRRSPSPERTLKLTLNGQTLELSAATEAQQQQLVEEFVKAAARA